jgi:4-hydroxybenzoate polyprenyltransferase
MALPRSGVDLLERIAQRWRWFVYRVSFHPLITSELPRLLGAIHDYVALTRLDRPIGIWLLLWPTLWALWIAALGKPDARLFSIFVAGTVLMRSAGCAINDYADRGFDPQVERTKLRPLAAGRISTWEALLLFAGLSLTALGLALPLNKLTLQLAVCGAGLAVTYPFIKRFLSVPQLYLGLTFGWGIPMAFTAQLGQWPPRVGWLLLLANVLWVTVYDTMYAMVDRDDDLRVGIRSTAILFGESDRHIIAIVQAMTLLALYLVGGMMRMGPWYYCGLAAGALFFVYQLWLIRAREREGCFRAFLNNNYFGMSVFLGIALNYQFARV